MAGWDDVSSPVQQQPANQWDSVSTPIATPKIPDTSGVQQMAKDNIAANDNTGEEAKPNPPQTASQQLDAAAGMPVSNVLKGGNAPLTSVMRGHLVDSYKAGTATDAGGFMQNILPAIGDVIRTGGSEIGKMEIHLLTSTPRSLASDVVQNTINLPMQGLTRLLGRGYQLAGGEMSVPTAETLTQGIPEFGGFKGQKELREALQEKVEHKPTTAAGEVTQATLGIAPYLAGGEGSALRKGIGALASGGGTVAGAEVAKEAGFGEKGQQVGRILGGASGMIYGGTSGHEALKEPVAEALGKDPKDVTPTDIDQTIAKSFAKSAPAAADFHTVAQAMDSNADTLHEIYRETGVHPDRVFEDARNNPEIAKAVAEGNIPEAYDHLRDTRPPIPEDIQKIMDEFKPEEKPVYSKERETASDNPLKQIFNPAGMSESSRDMATALRQGRGPENRDVAVIQDAMQKYAKTFAQMSDDDRLAFIDYMENRSSGAKLHDPALQEAADKIRDVYAQVAQKIQQNFPDVGLRKDYFTHQYKDEAKAEKFFSDWVAKQGSERNLQARAFPTLKEAMEAGLEPRTTNPIETVMRYVTNMGNLMAANRSVELAHEAGIADYFKKGQQPEGWVPLNGNLAEKEGKLLYAPEDAARVYNNDVSKGLTGPAGDILDNIQRMNNFANKLVLGLSGYHFTATTMASMASDVGRAINGGEATDIAKAVTPGTSTLTGQKFIDAYLGRAELNPELQQALDLAVKNNTINVKQQDYWKAGPAKDYVDIFKNGSLASEIKAAGEAIKEKPLRGSVGVIANEIGRTMDTVAKPLFDYYIPRIKIAANIQELHDWLQNHPDATPEMQDRAAQEIGNSIDNRFGEMMRDNLFWHAITKQTLQTTLLSYSWVAGAARMLQGVPDTAAFIMRQKELSSSARYLFGMAATYAAVNGVRTYIGTGHAPDDWMDFVYPRTGGKTPQGKEERELLPSHIGQYTNYLHEGIGELGNEASPGLKLIYHLLANKDWRGLPITNENNGWFGEQRWGDYAHYVLGEETPIGLKTFLQGNKKGSKISDVEKALGARQAPRFVSDPQGYEAMMKKVNDNEYKKKVRSDKKIKAQYEGDESP